MTVDSVARIDSAPGRAEDFGAAAAAPLARDTAAADIDALVDILLKLSKLSLENEETIDQIDLNPVIALSKGAAVVDARIILKEQK